MSELNVLGLGSPFGDDKAGWQVIKLLQQRPQLYKFTHEQLSMAYYDRPGMHLLELIKTAQTVFLIDAVKTGATIGTLHYFQDEEIMNINNVMSTHNLGITDAIQIGHTLQLLPKKVILYGIEIGDVQYQFTLSNPIKQAIKLLAIRITNDILSFIKPRKSS